MKTPENQAAAETPLGPPEARSGTAHSRRGFLRKTCLLGLVAPSALASTGGPTAANAKSAYAMLTDLRLCVGCRKCEWACGEANSLPPCGDLEDTTVFAQHRRTSASNLTVVNEHRVGEGGNPVYAKTQCMHCVDPACASACPVRALTKSPEGPVVYDESLCIGCRYCMVACPFNIPAYSYGEPLEPKVQKCSMCYDRVSKTGKLPACASVCPQEAITFGPRADLIALAHERIRTHPGQYVDHVYGEHEVGGTNWLYISPVPFEALGFPDLQHETAVPARTTGFLSIVPLVHAIWPMLLMGVYASKASNGSTERD